MRRIKKRHVFSAVLIALVAVFVQQVFVGKDESQRRTDDAATNSSNAETPDSHRPIAPAGKSIRLEPEKENISSTLIPVAALSWAAERGYHSAAQNGPAATRPYDHYDLLTLQKLADDGDGLAQLILAENLSFSDPKKADVFYMEAAINGKTAGLTYAAGDRLLIFSGQKGYGFSLADADGIVSKDYLEVLRFYAAAEYLGDFIGTELLASHLESADLRQLRESVRRICSSGQELAHAIIAERIRRWGSVDTSVLAVEWTETPDPICQQL